MGPAWTAALSNESAREVAEVRVEFGVLGPVTAWDASGAVIGLKGPRHRAVLGRLLVARGRTVPMTVLIDDLWTVPPENPQGAIQTFVSALRRAIEPDRRPRSSSRLLVTEGNGYALRAAPDTVDALRFEAALDTARTAAPPAALRLLDEAARRWRGPPYADFPDEPWATAERSRLTELRLGAAELRLRRMLDLDLADAAIADLDAHVAEHPWREEGWRLLALALYRAGRQRDALKVLRHARSRLADELGLEPGVELDRLQGDILRQAPHLDRPGGRADAAGQVWSAAVATYSRAVTGDARPRLRSTVELLRGLAVTGGQGLVAAREQRVASILAAEQTGDAELTAHVIGAYDVPAVWSRSDDPDQAAAVVAAAERTLAALPAGARPPLRARLLATIAVESRGGTSPRVLLAARRAEAIAREADDPALLAFALNGVFMQSFHRCGLAAERDRIGVELTSLAARHGLETYEILGRLIRMQALSGLGDVGGADAQARAVDDLADRYGSPLVTVFTTWHRALRVAAGAPGPALAAYRAAAALLTDAGMPGLERGLAALAELSVCVRHGLPAPLGDVDWGPYEPWARPHVLIARGRPDEAAAALRAVPDPPHDHLLEALWALTARAALAAGERGAMRRAHSALRPAAGEQAGGASGLLSVGPVAGHLADLAGALGIDGPTGPA